MWPNVRATSRERWPSFWPRRCIIQRLPVSRSIHSLTAMATMASKRDYYEVLNVQRTASAKEIAASYRKLALRYHPDSNQGDSDATALFKEAAEAYEVLSDENKRAAYDRFGHAGVEGGGHQFDQVEDIFEAFSGIFGDMFGSRRSRRPRRGADVRCNVTLDLEEAAQGVAKTVQFRRNRTCATCQGSGAAPGSAKESCGRCGGRGQVVQSHGILRVQTTCPNCRGLGVVITSPCKDCRGEGYVAEQVTRDVHIPAGIDDGTSVRIPGEGQPSPEGGQPGDCYCVVTVRPHRLFHREGSHLILQIPITYCQAALGAEVEVPTLSGPDTLTIPSGTASREVFRLRGRGMPDPRGGPVGDLLVQTYIEVPKKLTKDQRQLLDQLAELEHTHVTPHRKSFLEKVLDWRSK